MTLTEQLADKKILYTVYKEAEMKVLAGQRYRIGTRELQRADLEFIQKERERLLKDICEIEAAISGRGRRRAYRITPRDF